MSSKPRQFEMSLDQIAEVAAEISRLTDASVIYYFGSRHWDKPLSFGMIEFVIITSNPSFYTQTQQEDLMDKLSVSFDALFTFLEHESDVMSGAQLVWPPKA
ncbi:MAG: hypothetical protein EOP04_31865 [Proteobacteria bacterium]|nr:MAG: hypothetical protein EOP04_31865 [Pseudomonadota bacterium]